MAVRIGSARIDENGKAVGGKAGDQTGKEVSTQEWYKHDKTWRVFRALNPDAAEKIAQAMQSACDNSNIGYDQNQRLSLYNVAKLVQFNPALVKSQVETDCSALVRVCCAYAGIKLPDFYTADQPQTLIDSGKFKEMVGTKYTASPNYLKRGDILVTKTKGHTVVVLTDGPLVEGAVQPDSNYVVVVKAGSWHVRIQPDKNSESLGIVKEGTVLPYLNETKSGWDRVWYNGAEAWISARGGELELAPPKQYVEIKGSWYVRTAPNKDAEDIGVAHNGDKVPYQGQEKDGWYLVKFKNIDAWISKKSGKIV